MRRAPTNGGLGAAIPASIASLTTTVGQLVLGFAASSSFGTKTASFAVAATEEHGNVDTTSGAVTMTLPDPAAFIGRCVWVQKVSTDANAINVAPFASETVNGLSGTNAVSYSTFSNRPQWLFRSNGTNWFY